MLLYYQSWMFYNHFIVTLYHFLVLTYWHSAKCQLLFFAFFSNCRKSISDGVQMQRNFTKKLYGPQGRYWALVAPGGKSRGGETPPRRARRPKRALVGCAHLWCPRTATLLYKYPKNPRTLGESTKYSSSHCIVQNHQIQSRHHLGWGSPPPLVPLRWCVSSSL